MKNSKILIILTILLLLVLFLGCTKQNPSSPIDLNTNDGNNFSILNAKFGFHIFPILQMTTWGQIDKSKSDKLFSALEDLDADWIRMGINWIQAEPIKGTLSLDIQDKLIDNFVEKNVNVLVFTGGAPPWAAQEASGTYEAIPPKNPEDYADYLSRIVTRYKGKVSAWEVWNEPSAPHYWGGRQSTPEEYMALLKPAYAAIKNADPNTKVVGGCVLIQFLINDPDYTYLDGLLEQGLLDYSDIVSVHIYPKETPDAPEKFEEVLAIVEEKVRAYGDHKIWVTEVGRASVRLTPPNKGEATMQEHVDFIKTVYRASEKHRMFWFQLKDISFNMGVMDASFNKKSSYEMLKALQSN